MRSCDMRTCSVSSVPALNLGPLSEWTNIRNGSRAPGKDRYGRPPRHVRNRARCGPWDREGHTASPDMPSNKMRIAACRKWTGHAGRACAKSARGRLPAVRQQFDASCVAAFAAIVSATAKTNTAAVRRRRERSSVPAKAC
jgi:hypothetical protein